MVVYRAEFCFRLIAIVAKLLAGVYNIMMQFVYTHAQVFVRVLRKLINAVVGEE
jgi:hypothetical protein